jgi:hypothetical protein
MTTTAIINLRTLDINRISFVVGQAKSGRNPSIAIKYDGQNLGLRLPRLTFPFGVSSNEYEKGNVSYSTDGSLKGCDPYAKERANDKDDVGRLYNFLLDLHDKIIQSAVENSGRWFGKKRSEEGIREGLKPLMRLSADKVDNEWIPNGKYVPRLTLKIPVYDGKVAVDVIDHAGNPVRVTPQSLDAVIPAYADANMAVQPSIYVMAGGGFGVTWRITHAQVFPQSRLSAASVFADAIEPEEEVEAQEPDASAPVQEPPASAPEEETPVSAPPARKRRTAQPVA